MNSRVGSDPTSAPAAGQSFGERPFVSLSEALTWIAFSERLPLEDMRTQVEGERAPAMRDMEERKRQFFSGEGEDVPDVPGTGYFEDRPWGLDRLNGAWRQLRDAVDLGRVRVRGRFTSRYSLPEAHLADVQDLDGTVLATFSQFDVSTGGIRRQTEGSPEIHWGNHRDGAEREFDANAEKYNTNSCKPDLSAVEGYLLVEVEWAGLKGNVSPFDFRNGIRPSQSDTIKWCRQWIESGNGNGMDKAWKDFHTDPKHEGLSRDDCFRPAWRKAKTS